jgi:hypothetical protein
MTQGLHIAFSPYLPWPVLGVAAAIALVLLGFGVWRRARGVWARALALAVVLAALADPVLVEEQRAPQRDVALVVEDVSASQHLGDRMQAAARDADYLKQRLSALPGLDVRVVQAGAQPPGSMADTGTHLFDAVAKALADVPPQRVAGVALVTDGQVEDVPAPDRLGFRAPLHVLLTGHPDEGDRRLIVKQAPSFGLVGKSVPLTLRVVDVGGSPAARAHYPETADVTLSKDGGAPDTLTVPVGQDIQIAVRLDHGGPTVVELAAASGPAELTLDNNRAAFVINGVRDRLRVLLISGEPHPGERTWRNLLKADPSVDLVHFTILRPPEKQDGTPLSQLSLIAFPIRELFDEKLRQFDLVIFDRYRQTGVLPDVYLDNVARYVRVGGALLDAADAGDGAAQNGVPMDSLYATPLGSVLPAEPTGKVILQGFKPRVTALGLRHPVTADLPGAPTDPNGDPHWGRWFRQIDTTVHRGDVVMSGANGAPLLVLDRVGRGRVAELLSDDMWLWTRDFEGGGPQAELLRRLSYWLMKEPDLEENDLSGTISGDHLTIRRQSLHPDASPVTLTRPDGKSETVHLNADGAGRETAVLPIDQSGLYRISDGSRIALAAAGALNPVELADVQATPEKLGPVVEASGGGIVWAGTGADLPDIRRVDPGRSAAGSDWLGFRANGDYVVTGIDETPLLPPWAALALALGTLILAWRIEGR